MTEAFIKCDAHSKITFACLLGTWRRSARWSSMGCSKESSDEGYEQIMHYSCHSHEQLSDEISGANRDRF